MATLNRRNELVSTCRHRRNYILKCNWLIIERPIMGARMHVLNFFAFFLNFWIFKCASLAITDKQCRVIMLISDVSLNDASVCVEINRRVDQRSLVYETELIWYIYILTNWQLGYCVRGFCFNGGKKTRVHYVCLVLIVQVGRCLGIFLWGRGYIFCLSFCTANAMRECARK